jgi:hypothetical protein
MTTSLEKLSQLKVTATRSDHHKNQSTLVWPIVYASLDATLQEFYLKSFCDPIDFLDTHNINVRHDNIIIVRQKLNLGNGDAATRRSAELTFAECDCAICWNRLNVLLKPIGADDIAHVVAPSLAGNIEFPTTLACVAIFSVFFYTQQPCVFDFTQYLRIFI